MHRDRRGDRSRRAARVRRRRAGRLDPRWAAHRRVPSLRARDAAGRVENGRGRPDQRRAEDVGVRAVRPARRLADGPPAWPRTRRCSASTAPRDRRLARRPAPRRTRPVRGRLRRRARRRRSTSRAPAASRSRSPTASTSAAPRSLRSRGSSSRRSRASPGLPTSLASRSSPGNVSLYNETGGRSIPPTPVVGCVGLVHDVTRIPDRWQPGDGVFLLRGSGAELVGFVWQQRAHLHAGARRLRTAASSSRFASAARWSGREPRPSNRVARGGRRRDRCRDRAALTGSTSSSWGSSDVRCLRDPRARTRRRAAHLLRPASLCSTAVRSPPESRSARTARLTALRDLGLVAQVFDERSLSGLHGDLAIGHNRYSTTGGERVGERAAAAAPRPRAHRRSRSQRQPRERRGAAADGRQAARVELRLRGDRGADRRRRTAARAERSAAAMATTRRRRDGGRARRRGASSPFATRTASGRSSWAGSATTPWSRRRRARSTLVGADVRARGSAGRARDRRRRTALHASRRSSRPSAARSASSSSSTWHGPTHGCRASRCTARASEWASGSPPRRPVDADLVLPIPDSGTPAAIGFARATGHPVQRRADQESLRRPHVHPAGARECASRASG